MKISTKDVLKKRRVEIRNKSFVAQNKKRQKSKMACREWKRGKYKETPSDLGGVSLYDR